MLNPKSLKYKFFIFFLLFNATSNSQDIEKDKIKDLISCSNNNYSVFNLFSISSEIQKVNKKIGIENCAEFFCNKKQSLKEYKFLSSNCTISIFSENKQRTNIIGLKLSNDEKIFFRLKKPCKIFLKGLVFRKKCNEVILIFKTDQSQLILGIYKNLKSSNFVLIQYDNL